MMSWHCVVTRMGFHNKVENKCWRGRREIIILAFCWWYCTIEQTLWKSFMKTNPRIMVWPRNSTVTYLLHRTNTGALHTCMCMFIGYMYVCARSRTPHDGLWPRCDMSIQWRTSLIQRDELHTEHTTTWIDLQCLGPLIWDIDTGNFIENRGVAMAVGSKWRRGVDNCWGSTELPSKIVKTF